MAAALRPAPPLVVADWINTPKDLRLEDFRGKVLMIEAFQMLCPGCVSHGLPQAKRVMEMFDPAEIAVIGLHSVFEHHEAQGGRAPLEAFTHEYRLTFPIAIDAPSGVGGIPITMRDYNLQGTPSLILIDREGRRRMQAFGHVDDLRLGSAIASLLAEAPLASAGAARNVPALALQTSCADGACPV